MTFAYVMSVLIGIGGAFSTWLFRKGGPYNPVEPPLEPPKKPVEPLLPPQPPSDTPPAPKPTLTQLCTYMRDFEGKPGDANYRNCNPLNARFYDPKGTGTDAEYLPMYRPVKRSPGGFAIFKDMNTGWLYGFNMVKHKIKNHPEWTLRDLIRDHAPESDGNPVEHYAQNVARRLSTTPDFKVKDLVLV